MSWPVHLKTTINHRDKRPVVVLGMHRSGTSVLSRAMMVFGYAHSGTSLPADEHNQRGYWEDGEVVALNDALLGFLGRRWHDLGMISSTQVDALINSPYLYLAELVLRMRLEADKPLVLKDPRFSILLRFWKEVFKRCGIHPYYLFSTRQTDGIIASLEMRNEFTREKSLWLWIESTISALDSLVDQPVLLVSYERMLAKPESQLRRLSQYLEKPVLPSEAEEFCTQFLDQDLCNALPNSGVEQALPEIALDVQAILQNAAADDGPLILKRERLTQWLDLVSSINGLAEFARQMEKRAEHIVNVANERLRLLEATKEELRTVRDNMSSAEVRDSLGSQDNISDSESVADLEISTAIESNDSVESSAATPMATHPLSKRLEGEATVTVYVEGLDASTDPLGGCTSKASYQLAKNGPSVVRRSDTNDATEPGINQEGPLGLAPGPRRLLAGVLAAFRFTPFDSAWYHAQSRSLPRIIGVARFHYALFGAWRGMAPHAGFDASRYLLNNPDVARAGYSAEYHYMLAGWREGRSWKIISSGQSAMVSYADWIRSRETSGESQPKIRTGPLISILMPVYQVCSEYLVDAIKSVIMQTYANWELCIAMADGENELNRELLLGFMADDVRIRVEMLANLGIAANTNHALRMARGEYVALLDHDDVLSKGALADFASTIINNPSVDILYSDKDNLDGETTRPCHALFKPSWSPEMMLSVNYMTHLTAVRRSLANTIGGFRTETDGAQDWDFFFRAAAKARTIKRVPGIHYHWRIHPNSTASGIAAKPYALEAQRRSLEDEIQRQGLDVHLERSLHSGFHLRWKRTPTIHVIVNAVGSALNPILGLLTQLLADAEVTIVIDNNPSNTAHAVGRFRIIKASDSELTAVIATVIESVLQSPSGHADAILFLDARVQGVTMSGISELASWVVHHPGIGMATALILDERAQIVEAGLVVDAFGQGSPLFRDCSINHHELFGSPLWYRNCTACHPWCASVSTDLLRTHSIRSQLPWPSAFVQLCCDFHASGQRGLVNPHVRVCLQSRDTPPVPAFHHSLADDPYFHPAFSSVVPLRLHHSVGQPITAESLKPADPFQRDAIVLARQLQVKTQDWQAQQQFPERVGVGPGAGWCNWYLPNVSHVAYGGVMTIFRLADALTKNYGSKHRFYLIGAEDPEGVQNAAQKVFPDLAESSFASLLDAPCSQETPPADYAFATLWTTAYTLLAARHIGLKFYLIQDYEPLFYPAGSLSAQAALTYEMGFHHIYNTASLQAYCQGLHQTIPSVAFDPQIDPQVIYGVPSSSHHSPLRIFFYCRPSHPRNCFALIGEVMRLIKKRLGNLVEIVCAGEDFNSSDHDLEGVVLNYGRLDYHSSAALYRSCDIGVVLMLTRHPSYLPLELMASGTLVITNRNPANAWILQHGHNCLLTETSPALMAETIEAAVAEYKQLYRLRLNAQTTADRYSDWQQAFHPVMAWIQQLSEHPEQ